MDEWNDATVWALVDDRSGHSSQVLGLTTKLGLPYRIKKLTYNRLSVIPHRFLGATLAGIKAECHAQFREEGWPQIVIAAGRRTASVARYIKKQSPETKLVQIMYPGEPTNMFDLQVIPAHDRKKERPDRLITHTALHGLTMAQLEQEGARFMKRHQEALTGLPKPWVGVLIGGSSKHGAYQEHDYAAMLTRAKRLAPNGSLFITSSRRSDPRITAYVEDYVDQPFYLYDYHGEHAQDEPNPYMAILSLCDQLVVSGESVSMLSESCATGKPIYFFNPTAYNAPKDKLTLFQNHLISEQIARPLKDSLSPQSWKPHAALDEAARVADIIRTQWGAAS